MTMALASIEGDAATDVAAVVVMTIGDAAIAVAGEDRPCIENSAKRAVIATTTDAGRTRGTREAVAERDDTASSISAQSCGLAT